ncbi:ATP-binding protein [uncultured Fluviicola sp.]|uniref:ATP-binding protein n=1 Tax=uncultured Fluviicola sp. TaxID=463303 RepID=UPI0025D931ED|nr:ATP-binding protein [uncultured Fluviicola sp.]
MNKKILATSNYNTIQNLCDYTRSNTKMIAIIGYTGAGKTTAFEEYLENNEDVYYMVIKTSMTMKEFYSSLLNTLGIEGRVMGSTLHSLINQASHKLNYGGTKKLLIFDEAGKSKPKFFEYLHELRDNTKDTTGIIIAGPEYFHEYMKKWKTRGIPGIPEFYRRINHWEFLSEPTKEEIRGFGEYYNVTSEEAIQEMINSCKNFSEIMDYIEAYHQQKRKKVNK